MPQLDTLMDRTSANLDCMALWLYVVSVSMVDPRAASGYMLQALAMQEPAEA